MDDRTKQALLGSIAKWEAIVQGTGGDRAASNCPLCAEFMDQEDPELIGSDDGRTPETASCHGCPGKTASKQHGCIGTPYTAWMRGTKYEGLDVHSDWDMCGNYVRNEAQRQLAQAELDFLRSLLPQSEYPE